MEANATNRPTALKRFINLLSVDKKDIYSLYIYAVFGGIISLSLPLGIQAIINLIGSGQITTSWILLTILVTFGIGFSGILQIMQLKIVENIQQKIFTRSAFEFSFRIPRIRMESLSDKYVPELMNRFFDTVNIQKGTAKILMDFSTSSVQVIFSLILLSFYHPFFMVFSIVLLLLVFIIFRFSVPSGVKTSYKESSHKYEVAHWLEEIARNQYSFKLASISPIPMGNTDAKVLDYLKARKKHFKILLLQYGNLVAFKTIIIAGLLGIGGFLVIDEQMNIGQFVAAEIIIVLMLGSIEKLILNVESIYDLLTSVEKVASVTDLPLEKEPTYPSTQQQFLSLEFENFVLGSESDYQIIHVEELTIKSKEKICLSGRTGSGKSKFLKILAGFYSEFEGRFTIDGVPIDAYGLEKWREKVGNSLLLQKEDLFEGSLLENLSPDNPNANWEDLKPLADIVGLSHFIENLSEGIHTRISSTGDGIPEEMKLKIKLVRSLFGKPSLILLDDNLDRLRHHERNRIVDYMITCDKTVVLATNNREVLEKFDRVITMENGSIKYDQRPMKSHNNSNQ
jgi:ABC-type bacteriocin/lantibiotic exporter with double-glycine peptidase domain